MESMTTSFANPFSRPGAARVQGRRGGFTLVEVMICAAIGSFVLAGILATFVFLVKSSTGLYNYTGMEMEARRGLERFSQDTRMANAINWTDNTRVTVTVPHAFDSFANTVTYYWSTTAGSTYHCFLRQEDTTNSTGASTGSTTTTLIHDVETFQFDRWQAGGATGVQATSNTNTDQLQIHLTLKKRSSQWGVSGTALVAATNLVVSARYIMRNKPN
jgi:prepilin-type N-terminal cleavage/methylation domain-containing protein